MAYDPNDPKDVELVEGMIADAVKALKTKNTELIGELRQARKEGGADPGKIERLEAELAETQAKLSTAERAKTAAEGKAAKAEEASNAANSRANNLTKTTAIQKALAANKISDDLREAAEALIGSKTEVQVDGDNVAVMVGDKTIDDYVKEWSASDAGKRFVTAPVNGGGNADGDGDGGGSATKMSRTAFNGLTPQQRLEVSQKGVELTDG